MKDDRIEMYSGSIYCQSTGEEIFSVEEGINNTAKALIAYLSVYELSSDLVFNHIGFKRDWEAYIEKHPIMESEGNNSKYDIFYKCQLENNLYDIICGFLGEYVKPEWRVYEIITPDMDTPLLDMSGNLSDYAFWIVVFADTVVEGSDYDVF
jgi:hypothetical protein